MATLPDPVGQLKGKDKKIYERMLARRQKQGVGLYGPYIPLMHNPELAQCVEKLGYCLKFEGQLPREIYQFIVLTMASTLKIAFEWADHIEKARETGLPEEVIDALLKPDPGKDSFPSPFSEVYLAVQAALNYQSIPDDLQDRLIGLYGTKGLVEIVVVCGLYELIGAVNQCFDVPLPAGEQTARGKALG